jgi:hypothetical protein
MISVGLIHVASGELQEPNDKGGKTPFLKCKGHKMTTQLVTNIGGVLSSVKFPIKAGSVTAELGSLPANAQILNIYYDVQSADTSTISIGYPGSPTAYATGSILTPGRRSVTPTAAQCETWANGQSERSFLFTVSAEITTGVGSINVIYRSSTESGGGTYSGY